jgi:hypothetical protein
MMQDLASPPRDTGIDIVGEIPWGSHFSLFYENKRDLVEVLVPYLAAGLLAGELCVWMPSNPGVEAQVLDAVEQTLIAQARLGPVRRGVVDDEHMVERP